MWHFGGSCPSKACLIISGSRLYLQIHSIAAAWRRPFSTVPCPHSSNSPLVNPGHFLQPLPPATSSLLSFKIPFSALPVLLPQAHCPSALPLTWKTWILCNPPTLSGIKPPTFLVVHTGETILHPMLPAQALLASPHTPFPRTFRGPSLPLLLSAALHSPLYYSNRNTRFRDRGNIHLYYRQPDFLLLCT